MKEISDMLQRDNPLNVYNKLTLKHDKLTGPSNRKQVYDNKYNDARKQRKNNSRGLRSYVEEQSLNMSGVSTFSSSDDASQAAKSLLTLNTSTDDDPTDTKNVGNLVIDEKQTNDNSTPSAMFTLPASLNAQSNAISVRIDRSSGNPDVQILATPTESSSEKEIENVLQEASKPKVGEIFSTVTAVLQRKPDMSTEKLISLCKISDVTAVVKDNSVEISGSLKAVNTMYSLLQVLYKDTDTSCDSKKTIFTVKEVPVNPVEVVEIQDADKQVTSTSCDPGPSSSFQKLATEFTCPICEQMLPSEKYYDEHCRTMHLCIQQEHGSFKCQKCYEIFNSSEALASHVKDSHGQFACSVCGKEFALRRYLSMHMKRHNEENKKYACGVCGWKFLERHKLKLHMQSHKPKSEQNLPHSCNICGRQFYNKATLEDHKNTHTGNRPFTCDICSCSFAHRIGLKRHQAVHAVSKPYKCSTCNKEFAFKAKLDEHTITHTGEGKYTCINCGKIFTTKSSLKRHSENCSNKIASRIESVPMTIAEPVSIETNNPEAVFMCGICSMVFDTLEKASVHAASHET